MQSGSEATVENLNIILKEEGIQEVGCNWFGLPALGEIQSQFWQERSARDYCIEVLMSEIENLWCCWQSEADQWEALLMVWMVKQIDPQTPMNQYEVETIVRFLKDRNKDENAEEEERKSCFLML